MTPTAVASDAPEPTATLAERMVDFGLGLGVEDLSTGAIEKVKTLLLDTLGCALAARASDAVAIAEAVRLDGGPATATVWGAPGEHILARAALVNGVSLRYLDYMDVYGSVSVCHPSETIPVAFAECEAHRVTGRELVAAIAVGYELETRLCDAVAFSAAGLHHSSAAALVTPVVLGRLRGYGRGVVADAVAIGMSRFATLAAVAQGQLTAIKAFNYPLGALAALSALELARAGLSGPRAVLDGLAQHGGGGEGDLGHSRLLDVALKPYPVQFELQSVVEACRTIHGRAVGLPESLRSVEVRVSGRARARTADPDKYRPSNRETADHSLPYCAAVSLDRGEISVDDFRQRTWENPRIQRLMGMVNVVEDADQSHDGGAAVTVTTDAGDRITKRIAAPLGGPHRPMNWNHVVAKFDRQASHVLGAERAAAIAERVGQLHELSDIRELTRLLRPAHEILR